MLVLDEGKDTHPNQSYEEKMTSFGSFHRMVCTRLFFWGGVPVSRTIIFWGVYIRGPLFRETDIPPESPPPLILTTWGEEIGTIIVVYLNIGIIIGIHSPTFP